MRRSDVPLLALVILATAILPARAGFRNVYDRQVSSSYSVMEVEEAPDGGFAVAAGRPMFLLKTDSLGVLQFTMTYDADAAASLDATTDGGFVMAGEKLNYNDYLVVKTDAAGAVQWSQVYDQGYPEQGLYSIRQTSDGGFIASGISTLRLDAAGVLQWNRAHIGGGGNVNSVRQTSDDGFVATGEGSHSSPAGNYNFVVTRFDSSGAISWNRAFGGDEYDWSTTCEQTSDGGFIVAGWTVSFGAGGSDGFLHRLDAAGAVSWTFTYGTAGDDSLWSVLQVADGGFVVAGRFDSKPALMRVDASGALVWARAYPATAASSGGTLYSLIGASDGDHVATGKDESGRVVLLKVDAAGETGGCVQVDPGVIVAPASFAIADNATNGPGTWTSPAQTTTATPASTSWSECVVTANRPPLCGAGGDLLAACDGVVLSEASASDPDGDTLTFLWTSSCAGATFVPSADSLNPSVTFDLGCPGACDLTLEVSDGNGGTCSDTLSVDCSSLAALDCDGDGVANAGDCAPADPSAFAVPGEVPLLLASKLPGGDALLEWTDVSAAAGTGTRHDVVGGQISALWLEGTFAAAACVAQDVAAISVADGRALPPHAAGFPGDGWYYLVRAQNSCGASTHGSGTLGPRGIDPALCD